MFNESTLENAIIESLKEQHFDYIKGDDIHKELSDVLLRDDFRNYMISNYDLTSFEIDSLLHRFDNYTNADLYSSNKQIMRLISEGLIIKREDKTKQDLHINFINYDDLDKNIFKVVNQLEIQGIEKRIPDAIIYINGLPLVVFEFKSAVKENTTIKNAFEQITIRYTRDIPELFKYNAFCVISDGVNNKCGSIFSKYEFFYAWRTTEFMGEEVDGIDSLETMINGLFNKTTLIDVIHNFIYFPDKSTNSFKIVCRYPQYYAARKLLDNIKLHIKPKGDGKGGTYWGTTGCGKSFTMLFLSRLLMRDTSLVSPTIVIITDRTDLDDQISEQFVCATKYIGDENIIQVKSRDDLREQLQNRESGGVFLTTIQKFSEDINLLSNRSNIICISDEAHRSQTNLEQRIVVSEEKAEKKYGFAKYLHDSLPNATYVGFTGTPIDPTIEVFGDIVDRYTMTEAVEDEITVKIVYEGRASKVYLDEDKLKIIEDYYNKCEEDGANAYQIEESKKTVAKMREIIGHSDRLDAIARDFIDHYETRITEGATVLGKALFVCYDRDIAYKLYQKIIEIRPEWAEVKECDEHFTLSEMDKKDVKPMPKIKLVMTSNKDDPKDLYNMLGSEKDRKDFALQFKEEKSNFKIAMVVDMWLTGFDVPCLDTMYLDKPVQAHTLIQTISRVNRVYEGKDKGLVVDYIGIKSNMNKAIGTYTGGGTKGLEDDEQAVIIVKDQLDILARMLASDDGCDASDFFLNEPVKQLKCLKNAANFMMQTEEKQLRFMQNTKKLKQAYNLCTSNKKITPKEKDYIYFYLAVRSVIYKYTKGDAPDATQMNARVRQLIEDALSSSGIEEVFKIKETNKLVDIFSESYIEKIKAIPQENLKVKILERLLKQKIEEFKKVNKIKGVDFSKKMKAIIDKYNTRTEIDVEKIHGETVDAIIDLINELKTEQKSFEKLGIDYEEKAFYDILISVRDSHKFEYDDTKILELCKEIKKIVADKTKYTDCFKKADIKAELEVDLIRLLGKNGYPPEYNKEVYNEVFEQAENFKKYSMEE